MLLRTPDNYEKIISTQIRSCNNVWGAIAYVTESGVRTFLKDLKRKNFHLMCNTELGSKSLKAIKTLLSAHPDSKVKIYNPTRGKFHPKLWIFGSTSRKATSVVIGSANLTLSAMRDNVEIGVFIENSEVVTNSYDYFQYLWHRDTASQIELGPDLDTLIESTLEIEKVRKELYKSSAMSKTDNVRRLVEFVNCWIKIPTEASIGGVRIWRGWYILPDQGMVDDKFVSDLIRYLPLIKGIVNIGRNSSDVNWEAIMELFKKGVAGRVGNKTNDRDFFIRSTKNILIKFGWVEHCENEFGNVDKSRIKLTPTGERVRDASSMDEVRDIYTEYFMEFNILGLEIIPFLIDLMGYVEYITPKEMELFVKHAFSKDDLNLMVNLIEVYRGLSKRENEEFHDIYKVAFDKHKEYTAANVYGNFTKSVRHTMRAIAWCEPFYMDGENIKLR